MIIMTTSEGGVRVATQIDTLREYTSIDERGRSDITQCPSCGVFAVPRGITSTMKDDLGSFEAKHCPNCGHTYGRDTVAQSKSGTVIIEAYDVAAEVVDDDTPIAGALRVKFRLSAPFDFDDPDADIRLSYFTEENGELKPMFEARYGDRVHVTKSKPNFLEFIHPEGTKGHALRVLAEMFDCPLSSVIAIGDSWNDLEMLEAAGLGVAMGNAVPALKEVADYVTLSNNEEGVRHVLEKFVLGA